MIPDPTFKDIPSPTHFDAVSIHDRWSDVHWGTLYQEAPRGNWFLERRLSSTESEVVNMGTTEKRFARLYARELIWDLAKRGLLNPPPPARC